MLEVGEGWGAAKLPQIAPLAGEASEPPACLLRGAAWAWDPGEKLLPAGVSVANGKFHGFSVASLWLLYGWFFGSGAA